MRSKSMINHSFASGGGGLGSNTKEVLPAVPSTLQLFLDPSRIKSLSYSSLPLNQPDF